MLTFGMADAGASLPRGLFMAYLTAAHIGRFFSVRQCPARNVQGGEIGIRAGDTPGAGILKTRENRAF